jgi:hypothetical protein
MVVGRSLVRGEGPACSDSSLSRCRRLTPGPRQTPDPVPNTGTEPSAHAGRIRVRPGYGPGCQDRRDRESSRVLTGRAGSWPEGGSNPGASTVPGGENMVLGTGAWSRGLARVGSGLRGAGSMIREPPPGGGDSSVAGVGRHMRGRWGRAGRGHVRVGRGDPA